MIFCCYFRNGISLPVQFCYCLYVFFAELLQKFAQITCNLVKTLFPRPLTGKLLEIKNLYCVQTLGATCAQPAVGRSWPLMYYETSASWDLTTDNRSRGSSGSHNVQTGHAEMPLSLALASFMGGPWTLGKQGDLCWSQQWVCMQKGLKDCKKMWLQR